MESQPASTAAIKWGRTAMASGLVGGVAALALLASVVRVPTHRAGMEMASEGRGAPGLVISRVDRLSAGDGLRERLWLLNPSPLYMPVADSAGPSGLPERPGGRAAEMFSPELLYPERRPGAVILKPAIPATAAVAAADLADARWFKGMTRSGDVGDAPVVPAVRAARLTLYKQGVARAEAVFDLVADSVLGSVVWRPVELIVVIDAIGAVSKPTMAASSGEERADERIREVVGREFLSKLSLRPGIYRVEVGP